MARLPRTLFALAAILLPGAARACTVCFGGDSPDMAKGLYWGVMLLLTLPFGLMFLLVGLIVHHARKHAKPETQAVK